MWCTILFCHYDAPFWFSIQMDMSAKARDRAKTRNAIVDGFRHCLPATQQYLINNPPAVSKMSATRNIEGKPITAAWLLWRFSPLGPLGHKERQWNVACAVCLLLLGGFWCLVVVWLLLFCLKGHFLLIALYPTRNFFLSNFQPSGTFDFICFQTLSLLVPGVICGNAGACVGSWNDRSPCSSSQAIDAGSHVECWGSMNGL